VSGAFYTTVSWLAKDLRTYKYPLIQTQVWGCELCRDSWTAPDQAPSFPRASARRPLRGAHRLAPDPLNPHPHPPPPQGLLIVSLIPNAIGLLAVGYAIDRGMRAVWSNAVLVAVGSGLGFAVFKGVSFSLPTAWGLVCMFHLVIGGAMANVALPCTRIYEPLQVCVWGGGGDGVGARSVKARAGGHSARSLRASLLQPHACSPHLPRPAPHPTPPHPPPPPSQRTTGFSFGYNCGYGVLGGLSPLAVAAIKSSLGASAAAFAPALWLLCLGAVSILGCIGLSLYQPRLARPFVGRIE
jgi:hypothetical protein